MNATQPTARRGRHAQSNRPSGAELRQSALSAVIAFGILMIGTVLKVYAWSSSGPYSTSPVQTILVHVVIGALAGLVMIGTLAANIVSNLTRPRKSLTGNVLLSLVGLVLAASYAWTIYEVVRLTGHL